MRDLLDDVRGWRREGRTFALATIVSRDGSSPRSPGAAMVVAEDGDVRGSISGGCVDGALFELAQEVLATGRAERVTYGITDDDLLGVGLTCGGVLDVLVEPVRPDDFPELDVVLDATAQGRAVVLATATAGAAGLGTHLVVDRDATAGTLGRPDWDRAVTAEARRALGTSQALTVGLEGRCATDATSQGVFLQSFAPAPRMIVFGAIDFAGAVARLGTYLGYRVTVCDPRSVFATPQRFPDVDELVVQWPHVYLAAQEIDETAMLCVLTHDPKFDIPLLRVALETPARYIGVMGSRRTHADRMRRLREAGVTEAQLARLRSPIGLDLGASSPEETAVAVVAEIIASGTGRSGQPLRGLDVPIHA